MTMFNLTDRERLMIEFALQIANLDNGGDPCDKHRAQGGHVRADCPLCVQPTFTEADEREFADLAARIGDTDGYTPPADLLKLGEHVREAEHCLSPVIGFVRMGIHVDDEEHRLVRSLEATREAVRILGQHGADPVANVFKLSPEQVKARSDELAAEERKAHVHRMQSELYDYLVEHGEASQAEIARALDVSETTALRKLDGLVHQGRITLTVAGRDVRGPRLPDRRVYAARNEAPEPFLCGCGATKPSECCARAEGYFTRIGERSDEELRTLGEDDGCVAAKLALEARKAS